MFGHEKKDCNSRSVAELNFISDKHIVFVLKSQTYHDAYPHLSKEIFTLTNIQYHQLHYA